VCVCVFVLLRPGVSMYRLTRVYELAKPMEKVFDGTVGGKLL
jgi:hypothetical protein